MTEDDYEECGNLIIMPAELLVKEIIKEPSLDFFKDVRVNDIIVAFTYLLDYEDSRAGYNLRIINERSAQELKTDIHSVQPELRCFRFIQVN